MPLAALAVLFNSRLIISFWSLYSGLITRKHNAWGRSHYTVLHVLTSVYCVTYNYVSVIHRFKMKVGSDLNDDIRRAAIFREEIGWDNFLVSE